MSKSPRRVHDSAFKTKVVLEALKGAKTLAQLATEFGIHPQQITDWKKQALDGLPTLFDSPTAKPTLSKQQREEIEEPLFQQIGKLKAAAARSKTTGWAPPAQKKITSELIADRRVLIDPADGQFSIAQQCALLGLARSSYYYQPVGESAENLALMERIDKLFTARPEMGVRRMYHELNSPDNPVNIKRVRRLMRLMGLEAIGPKPNLSKPQQGHTIYPYLLKGVVIDRPNYVWSTDITYVPMSHGFLYLCAVIERSGVPVVQPLHSELAAEQHAAGRLLCRCIEGGFVKVGQTRAAAAQIFNTDQGSQFTSHDFLTPLISNGIAVSMDSKGRALDNIFIERFWRTIKYERSAAAASLSASLLRWS